MINISPECDTLEEVLHELRNLAGAFHTTGNHSVASKLATQARILQTVIADLNKKESDCVSEANKLSWQSSMTTVKSALAGAQLAHEQNKRRMSHDL